MAESYRIVVVDDEAGPRRALVSMLERRGHAVLEAADGQEALALIGRSRPHMVIADTQMPGMNGFAVLEVVGRKWPDVRRVLVTALDVDSHISMVRQYGIGNILPKGASLQSEEVGEYLDALLSGDVFGLERYFRDQPVRRLRVHTPREASEACAAVVGSARAREPLYLEMAVDELVSNAVFHGVLHGVPRERWQEGYQLAEADSVTVAWASDTEKVGVSITDPKGDLRTSDVLEWLDQPLKERQDGEEHGRGLLLVRKLVDRFVVNIRPRVTTECIVFQYHRAEDAAAGKPILIHEV
jgi:CheY-like chemotaxis protein